MWEVEKWKVFAMSCVWMYGRVSFLLQWLFFHDMMAKNIETMLWKKFKNDIENWKKLNLENYLNIFSQLKGSASTMISVIS